MVTAPGETRSRSTTSTRRFRLASTPGATDKVVVTFA